MNLSKHICDVFLHVCDYVHWEGRARAVQWVPNAIYLDTRQLTINPSMQSDQNGHWSHLSDLPSQGAPLGCTTICDIVT